MAVAESQNEAPGAFALALRRFRNGRRMSQLDLALTCNVSARHLSFLETGRAHPSREMVLQLAEGLVLPYGSRNALLHAAGFTPAFPTSDLDSAALEPFRAILTEMMERHAPYPVLLCDRHWNVRDASPSAQQLLSALAGDTGEQNVVRLLTRSPAASEVIDNFAEVLDEMTSRIQLEALEAGDDPVLEGLLSELEDLSAAHPYSAAGKVRRPLMPLVLNTPLGQLSFLSTIAHFGTSEDVTVRDLRLELLFPMDDATREAMQTLASSLIIS